MNVSPEQTQAFVPDAAKMNEFVVRRHYRNQTSL